MSTEHYEYWLGFKGNTSKRTENLGFVETCDNDIDPDEVERYSSRNRKCGWEME